MNVLSKVGKKLVSSTNVKNWPEAPTWVSLYSKVATRLQYRHLKIAHTLFPTQPTLSLKLPTWRPLLSTYIKSHVRSYHIISDQTQTPDQCIGLDLLICNEQKTLQGSQDPHTLKSLWDFQQLWYGLTHQSGSNPLTCHQHFGSSLSSFDIYP